MHHAAVIVRFRIRRHRHQRRLRQQVEPGNVALLDVALRRQILQRAGKAARHVEEQPGRQRRGPPPLIEIGFQRLIPRRTALEKSCRDVAGIVVTPLVVVDVGDVQLVMGIDRPRSLSRHGSHEVVVHELAAVRVVAAEPELIEPDEFERADPPHLVAHERTRCRGARIVDMEDLRTRIDVRVRRKRFGRNRGEQIRSKRRGNVVGLQVLIGAVEHVRATQRVRACLGDHVVHDAPAGRFRRAVRGLVVDLLEHERVVVHRHVAGGADRRVDIHPVDLVLGLAVRIAAVDADFRLLKRLRAAHVVFVHGDARHQARNTPQVVRPGQHVEHLALHDGLVEGARRI